MSLLRKGYWKRKDTLLLFLCGLSNKKEREGEGPSIFYLIFRRFVRLTEGEMSYFRPEDRDVT